jgi:hypothetical protein
MIVMLHSPTAAQQPPIAPVRDDGTPYRYELIYDAGASRAYADTPVELLGVLIKGYEAMGEAERTEARRTLAIRQRAIFQARLVADFGLGGCTPEERTALLAVGGRAPMIESWKGALPLVLVDCWYQPVGKLPRPQGRMATPQRPNGIIWFETQHEMALLRSMVEAGMVSLRENRDSRITG